MARSILLARHGTHDEVGRILSGRSAIGLNASGHAEAAALAARLADEPLAEIHASPRPRTQQTAVRIADPRGLPVVTTAALDEIDFGSFTGRDFAELDGDADWQLWNARRATARCPGGETMEEVVARALGWMRGIGTSSGGGSILAVTHCDVIRGMIAFLSGAGLDRLYDLPCAPGSLARFSVDAARDGGAIRIVSLPE
ncbi:phosphoglycerate mutase [Sphingomonas metalli]|uniref:Phosphoglycerate mutase n=1 Tax=Sphingomonas metalli TaxID=1779358 RepID=A0A916T167_9SPHN|nr:histidine phosphatase family protein [Sphingomonas metalli]GGB27147.1 phosphoglycerate mutase [Sphingomonas metalli]